MGNYTDLEPEFIERTISLIGQYTELCEQFPFEEQYNYTLTINCLLGLIVMPKEKVITFVPNERLTQGFKQEIGLENSEISQNVDTLRGLIFRLRHAVAHFDINVISNNEDNLINYIEFKDTENDEVIAKFQSEELHPFLQYYSGCLINNIKNYRVN